MQDDQKRKAEKEDLERLLLEGLEGEETPMTAQDWSDIRREAREIIWRRRNS